MKNNEFVLASIGLVLVVTLAGMHGTKSIDESTRSSRSPDAVSKKNEAPPEQESNLKQLEQSLERESLRVGQVTQDPERTKRELSLWAQSLNPQQLIWLKQKCLDTDVSGDERSLSVYLLAEAGSDLSLKQLSDIALTPINQSQNDRLFSFEEALRAEAIDGITKHENSFQAKEILKQIKSQTNSNFLNLRASQSLAFLNGQSQSPESQDHKILGRLLYPESQKTH